MSEQDKGKVGGQQPGTSAGCPRVSDFAHWEYKLTTGDGVKLPEDAPSKEWGAPWEDGAARRRVLEEQFAVALASRLPPGRCSDLQLEQVWEDARRLVSARTQASSTPLPCPTCGSEPVHGVIGSGVVWMGCAKCNAGVTGMATHKDGMVCRWNSGIGLIPDPMKSEREEGGAAVSALPCRKCGQKPVFGTDDFVDLFGCPNPACDNAIAVDVRLNTHVAEWNAKQTEGGAK